MINNEILSTIAIKPTTTIKHTIIWLHGLGADGNDFAPIVPELRIMNELGIKFIFPHAPEMPVTINNGYVMRAWFDITTRDFGARVDNPGMMQSVASIYALIDQEIDNGINSENILLAGFSQGSVIATITGLTYPKRLGGIVALSGFLPHADTLLKDAAPANQHTPIFMAHGTEDAVVPYKYGEDAYKSLKAAGYPISFHGYAMAHAVCGEEIRDIASFIKTIWQ